MVLLAFGQGRKDHLALMMTLLTLVSVRAANQDPTPDIDAGPGAGLYKIEGKIVSPEPKPSDWHWNTRILVDGGWKSAFIRENDHSFAVLNLAPGSYLIEVTNPDFFYEPVRVDITSKGKIRARKVNNLQPNQVNQLPYPLKMKPIQKVNYFQKREEWKISDVLMNPMIMMMVLPLLLMTVLPKMLNDPETQKEMQEMQKNMASSRNQMPEVSEVFANLFGGGQAGGQGQAKRKRPVNGPRR